MPQARLTDEQRLFTVGYQGHDLASFTALLEGEGIERVVDVRENPWSRKPGFSEKQLEAALQGAGIGYVHLGALGAPREVRDQELSKQGFLEAYRAHLDDQREALQRLRALAREQATAIMCMEKAVSDCHRQVIAERFERAGWHVVHLT